jgi:TIR domain
MEKLSIFLSHLTVESKLADMVKGRLVHDFIGLVDVFVSSDRTSIPVGSRWLSEVNTALSRASVHVILCSPESVARPWIQFEAGAAQIRGIPIIPICHSGLTPAQLPVPLSEWEGVNAASASGMQKFYDSIAKLLGSDVPAVDFEVYASEVITFETEYKAKRSSTIESPSEPNIDVIKNPRVLCISSPQFLKLGFENQIEIVINAFPGSLPHERVFALADLRNRLSSNRYDIVHIAAFVCPRTGDLYFSDVDLDTGRPTTSDIEKLSADALSSLLKMAETKLVVITSCESLMLAAILVEVTNVVATKDLISSKMMAAWVENFYKVLPTQPLSMALEFAAKESRAPMRFYGRVTTTPKMQFTASSTASNKPTEEAKSHVGV